MNLRSRIRLFAFIAAGAYCLAVGVRAETKVGDVFPAFHAAGLVPLDVFYGSLADRVFHSTQYLRHPSAPLYTPEPDIVHEVIGHGNLLADPQIAEVKRLAGEAARRCETDAGLQYLADVFWWTLSDFRADHSLAKLDALLGEQLRGSDIPV